MLEIKETTPQWTFKKQLENHFGKMSKTHFHNVWKEYFAPSYTRINISRLNEDTFCTLCGHDIHKQLGELELTGNNVVKFKDEDVVLPNKINVGCDCYANKLGPVLKIVEKLQDNFNGIRVSIEGDKINILKLINELMLYYERNSIWNDYKIMIPVKYLVCNHYDLLNDCMIRTKQPKYYPTNKAKKGISNVVFKPYDKPLSKVKQGSCNNTKEHWEILFGFKDFIIVINSDMIASLTNEHRRG